MQEHNFFRRPELDSGEINVQRLIKMVAVPGCSLLSGVAVIAVLCGITLFVASSYPSRQRGWGFALIVVAAAAAATCAWLMLTASRRGAERERFTETAAATAKNPFETGPLANGLTAYLTCLDPQSYTAVLGKTWRNVAPKQTQQTPCASGMRDFAFKTTPAFSPKDGFVLGTNTLTGPYSHQLGLNCDQAMSVVILGRITGDVSSPVSMFQLYANTPNNNGLSLTLSDGTRDGTLIKAKAKLRLGNIVSIPCTTAGETITYDPRHKYMWVVAKDYGRLRVLLVDADADVFQQTVILDTTVGAHDSIRLSNVDMTVNEAGTWNGNVFALGLYSRALQDRDLSMLFELYKVAFKAFDPDYVALQAQLAEAALLKQCPYDPTTCAACGGVSDWTNPAEVMAGGESCLRQIDRYCTANPQHARCSCWSANNPEYDKSCQAYRSAFSGVARTCTIGAEGDGEEGDDDSRNTSQRPVGGGVDLDSLSRLINVIDARRDMGGVGCKHRDHGQPWHTCGNLGGRRTCRHRNHGKCRRNAHADEVADADADADPDEEDDAVAEEEDDAEAEEEDADENKTPKKDDDGSSDSSSDGSSDGSSEDEEMPVPPPPPHVLKATTKTGGFWASIFG
jgi:hypothetical protein